MVSARTAVYPGSFNPPTIAHFAVSEAALVQRGLTSVVWMVSERALGKLDVDHGPTTDRLEVLNETVAAHEWLRVEATEHQLLSDIAESFDVVIMGADKWHQINELHWYDDHAHRDQQLARLPELAIAPRAGLDIPDVHALDLDPTLADVSSSAARAGDHGLILPSARPFFR